MLLTAGRRKGKKTGKVKKTCCIKSLKIHHNLAFHKLYYCQYTYIILLYFFAFNLQLLQENKFKENVKYGNKKILYANAKIHKKKNEHVGVHDAATM